MAISKMISAIIGTIFLTACSQTREIQPEEFKIRGIYVGASDLIIEKVKEAERLNINAVVIDIKDDNGEITCDLGDSTIPTNSNIKDIKSLIGELKQRGIYTIARIVTFKDKTTKDLLIKNADGSIYVDKEKMSWLNPYNKKVWEYIEKIAEAVAKIGFAEIQFDYIRLPQYKSLEETEISNDLKKKSKIQIINEFLDFIVPRLHAIGVKVSVDVFGCIIPESLGENSHTSSQNIGQDYVAIANKVDYICPMIYPSHWPAESMRIDRPDLNPKETVKRAMEFSKRALGENGYKVRPWLQAFSASWLKKGFWQRYTIKQINEQIEPLSFYDISQYCLWNSASKYEF